jgi:tetratricopeptide (TPR) repeat protein
MRTARRPREITLTFFVSILLLLATPLVSFGKAPQDNPDRQRAFQLYREGKFGEALPVFEKLAVAYPKDAQIIELYGYLVINQQVNLKDAAARKEVRRRGRELLVKAKELGADSALLKSLLSTVPEDGGDDVSFSNRAEVDAAMQTAEQAFANGNFNKAIEFYQQALLLDPKLYEAALFTGDSYFRLAEQRKASEWFARAVALDPDRETAYRYWGESLIKQGKLTEAGDKFIESYIADPYSRLARAGFLAWGERANLTLMHPEVEIPTSVTPKENGNLSISIDANSLKDGDGAGAAWMAYGFTRASWSQEEFLKQHPREKKYRHSLKEEVAALRMAVGVVKRGDSKKADVSLQIVEKLDKEGLLESFILLGLPDEGIAQDYLEYRKGNIEKLRKYVNQYVLTGGGK